MLPSVRVLVAEDHPSLVRSITHGLRSAGYAVDFAVDGGEAMSLASSNGYDGIVLDIMLPVMDGWSVLQALRRKEVATPVLCLTARDSIEDRVRGLELGADDYLVKPFAWEEFVARVRAMIRRGHAKPFKTIVIGDLQIDAGRKGVCRGGNAIELSAGEYALLEFLAYRRDEVVSRTEIWEHLYDQNAETTSNVVDVYIGYLRSKVDRDFEKKLIHTRRGQGYMLSEHA